MAKSILCGLRIRSLIAQEAVVLMMTYEVPLNELDTIRLK